MANEPSNVETKFWFIVWLSTRPPIANGYKSLAHMTRLSTTTHKTIYDCQLIEQRLRTTEEGSLFHLYLCQMWFPHGIQVDISKCEHNTKQNSRGKQLLYVGINTLCDTYGCHPPYAYMVVNPSPHTCGWCQWHTPTWQVLQHQQHKGWQPPHLQLLTPTRIWQPH